MGGLGYRRPFPFQLGGGPSKVDIVYDSLKQAVGVGGSAADGTLEANWRLARARGIAGSSAIARAVFQGFPDTSTDFIPLYEELLGIIPERTSSDQDRREIISERWWKIIDATATGIETELQKISTLFSVLDTGRSYTKMSSLGRFFQDEDPSDSDACGPEFGGARTITAVPNHSTEFVCVVEFGIPAGAASPEQKRMLVRAGDLLNECLPAWVDYRFTDADSYTDGFILDLSLLGLGSFNA